MYSPLYTYCRTNEFDQAVKLVTHSFILMVVIFLFLTLYSDRMTYDAHMRFTGDMKQENYEVLISLSPGALKDTVQSILIKSILFTET